MVFTTTTAADGTYRIDGLPLGAYTVSAHPPVELSQTYDFDGVATAGTSAVSLTAGAPVNLLQDFSYTGTASLGDRVWHDRNADGVVDPGEEGSGGVTVTATWAGPDGTFGTADDIVLPTVTTAPEGPYRFPHLPAGSYTVTVGQHRTDVDFGLREIADLMIVKSHPAGGIDPGGWVKFRITVTNLGPGTAGAVEVVCDLGANLLADDVVFFDVTTTATLAAAPGVLNAVVVTSDTPDLVSTNNTSVDPVKVDAADLSIKKVCSWAAS